MTQLAMRLPMPMARRTDPETSHLAAASSRELQAQHHAMIHAALIERGPMGKDEIARATGLTGVQCARRLPEMFRLRTAAPTGLRVESDTGRPERQWRAMP